MKITKKGSASVSSSEKVEGKRDYGGAYDIDPYQYFTRDEIIEFGDGVAFKLSNIYDMQFRMIDVYIVDYSRIVVELSNDDDTLEVTGQADIDMRKVRKGADIHKFADAVIKDIQDDHEIEDFIEYVESCSNVTASDDPEYEGPDWPDPNDSAPYEFVATKSVQDSDGFYTDYSMYYDPETDTYFMMFGDIDLTEPDPGYADWECETLDRAWEWFNSYNGFADEQDDIELSTDINASFDYDAKDAAIEELAMDGEVSLGRCSKSTLYRWARDINDRLEFGKYDWRVKPNITDNSLKVVSLEDIKSNDIELSEDIMQTTSSTDVDYRINRGKVLTNCPECGAYNRVLVEFPDFKSPFPDTKYTCKNCGSENILIDPHTYDENGYITSETNANAAAKGTDSRFGDKLEIRVFSLALERFITLKRANTDSDFWYTKSGRRIYSGDITTLRSHGHVSFTVDKWNQKIEEATEFGYQDEAQEFEEYEDDIKEIDQEFTSENTSINSTKLPAVFKMVSFAPGTINIDYGGGRFDNVADYLTQYDVINLVYDPYNRTPEHNKEVIKTIRKAGGADTATCSNVLNVIKEPEVRKNVLENIKKLVKSGGAVYITVYEGNGSGEGSPTKSGYQTNRKTADYLDEINEVFPNATRRGKLIVAKNSSDVASSERVEFGTEGSDSQLQDSEIYQYLEECGGYTDYNQKIEDLCEQFGLTRDDAETYVANYASGLYSDVQSAQKIEADYLDPPEYPEPDEVDPWDETIELDVDAYITVDNAGSWVYCDSEGNENEPDGYSFCRSNEKSGDWHSEEYSDILIGDLTDICEDFDSLIEANIPAEPGFYHITCKADLVYEISGVERIVTDQWFDEDHGHEYDEEIYTDNAETDFILEKSSVRDFNFDKIG